MNREVTATCVTNDNPNACYSFSGGCDTSVGQVIFDITNVTTGNRSG